MNKIYSMTVAELTSAAVDFIKQNYPKRYKKSLEFKDENDAALCLCVSVLFDNAGIKEDEVFYTENGKPYLKDGRFLSVSHSGKYCVLAVFGIPVGVDIERVGRVAKSVANRFFTECEQAWAGDDEVRLTVLWTLKEALSKLTGDGVKMLYDGIDVLPLTRGKSIILDGKKITAELQFLGDYVLAIIKSY